MKLPSLLVALGIVAGTSAVLAQDPRDGTIKTTAGDRHLAPHDTFYTLEYVSARTDKGVEGFPPGTEVHLVSVNREAHTLTVSDGKATVEVPPGRLTNDLDIAEVVKAKDDARQARIAAYQQAQEEAYQNYQKDVADSTTKDLEKRQQEIRDANTRAQEQANAERETQSASTSVATNGYYNEGGSGWGSPYGYFIDPRAVKTAGHHEQNATGTVSNGTNGGNRGAAPSQGVTAPQARPAAPAQVSGGKR